MSRSIILNPGVLDVTGKQEIHTTVDTIDTERKNRERNRHVDVL